MGVLDLSFFSKFQAYAMLLLRLTFGLHLLIYSGNNVFSYARKLEFRNFLAGFRVPYPLFAAFLLVYAQFTCGLLLLLGYKVRLAGLFLFINLGFALLIAHIGTPYAAYFAAAQLIAMGLFFMLQRAGAYALDARPQKPPPEPPHPR